MKNFLIVLGTILVVCFFVAYFRPEWLVLVGNKISEGIDWFINLFRR